MALLFSPDWLSIEKLVNVAGITNEDTLSHVDRSRLLIVKDKLRHLPSDSIENMHLTDFLQKLYVAIAPHKRIPHEILELILRDCLEISGGGLRLPPTRESIRTAPLVLGQVCSTWRSMSRSIPELWNTTYLDFTKEFKDLRCASEILPDVAKVHFEVRDISHNKPFPVKDFLPYLDTITELEWCIDRTLEQPSMTILPPESLSRLTRLSFGGQDWNDANETPPTYNIPLFGKESRLQSLILESNAPSFLLTDIPWSQLHTFHVVLYFEDDDDEASWRWMIWGDLAAKNPFGRMSSLNELTLALPPRLGHLFLSHDFPWHQLTSFAFFWTTYAAHDLHQMIKTLQKCTSLKNLRLVNDSDFELPISGLNDTQTVASFHLHTIELKQLPSTLVKYLCVPDSNPRELTISTLEFSDFYLFTNQCSSLVELSCSINIIAGYHISLPNLRQLQLEVQGGSLLDLSLFAPAVVSLTVEVDKEARDVVDGITQLITRSNMNPRDFWLHGRSAESVSAALLSALESCHSLTFRRLPLSRDCVNCIVSRSVLRDLKSLRIFTVLDPQNFFDIVKAKVAAKIVGTGWGCHTEGYSLTGGEEFARVKQELAKLAVEHRLSYSLQVLQVLQ
ncbi:hypothetical protein H0H92_006735 [Tricholoma furcatifolium]|nr:hypothetical protein H0H92_006735 [Tricholoma furcatifolium]